jgi:vitamin B12 transporter
LASLSLDEFLSIVKREVCKMFQVRPFFPPLVVLLAQSIALPARAEPTSTERVQEVTPQAQVSERLVVTATRLETSTNRLGSSISVITAEDLARRQAQLVVEVLATVPGIDVRRTGPAGSATSIFIRGADSDHTLVLIDGVELNDPSSPSRLAFLNHLTVDSVERIEVLRGPQSTLYGSDAIGGVIQIFTKQGSTSQESSLSIETGSYATWRSAIETSGASGPFDYLISGSFSDSDGFSASSGGVENDGYRNGSLAARLGWSFETGSDPNAGVEVVVRHTNSSIEFDGFFAEEDHQIDAKQTTVLIAPHFSLLDGRWEQKVSLQSARHERDTRSSFPSQAQGRLYALGWQNDLKLRASDTLSLGVESEWEEAKFSAFEDTARTVAFYAQYQIALAARSDATLGLRRDDHSVFGAESTYRLALSHRIDRIKSAGTVLRGSYGTGFKAPAISQLNTQSFGGNPNLKPETSTGYDLGIEQSFLGNKFALGATYFKNQFDHLIIAVFDPNSGGFQNINIDRAQAAGVEASVAVRFKDHFGVRANYTRTDSEAEGQPAGFGLTPGSELLRRPKHKGNLEFDYQLLNGRGNLALATLLVGNRLDLDPNTFQTVRADSYTRVDLSGRYTITSALEIYGRLENLLDEDYQDVLGFGTAGRSGTIGLKLDL